MATEELSEVAVTDLNRRQALATGGAAFLSGLLRDGGAFAQGVAL